eukprot:3649468-Rhodomonas_salina.1
MARVTETVTANTLRSLLHRCEINPNNVPREICLKKNSDSYHSRQRSESESQSRLSPSELVLKLRVNPKLDSENNLYLNNAKSLTRDSTQKSTGKTDWQWQWQVRVSKRCVKLLLIQLPARA